MAEFLHRVASPIGTNPRLESLKASLYLRELHAPHRHALLPSRGFQRRHPRFDVLYLDGLSGMIHPYVSENRAR